MRVKDFQAHLDANPDYVDITNWFGKVCGSEGLRVNRTAQLNRLLGAVYRLGANADLEPDPIVVSAPTTTEGSSGEQEQEAASDSGESAEDSGGREGERQAPD